MPVHRFDNRVLFDAVATPTAVVTLDLRILDANRAYVAVTGRRYQDLLGMHIFEIFPEHQGGDSGSDGAASLRASMIRALETGERQAMFVQRFDLVDAEGRTVARYWNPVNSPIIGPDGELEAILHQVEDVTAFREDLVRALDFFCSEAEAEPGVDQEVERRFAEYISTSRERTRLYGDLVTEVGQLREALTSRSTIDQAIGIVMSELRCTAQDGFEVLSRLSQNSNVQLRDVAAALVYRASGSGTGPLVPSTEPASSLHQ